MTHVTFKNLTARQRKAYILRVREVWRLRRMAVELGIAVRVGSHRARGGCAIGPAN
jgi:hypothetical protein